MRRAARTVRRPPPLHRRRDRPEFSAIIAGGIAPFVGALLLGWFSNSWIPLAIYVVVLTSITLYTTFVTPETRARDLTLLPDAIQDTPNQVATRPEPLATSYRVAEKLPPVPA